jgi:hypothetical protein
MCIYLHVYIPDHATSTYAYVYVYMYIYIHISLPIRYYGCKFCQFWMTRK